MMVWPFLLGLSVIVAGMAVIAGRGRYIVPALAILGAYLTVRLFVSVGVPSPSTVYALIWIFAATAIMAHNWRNYGISTILALSAMCYLWARAAGVTAAFGVLPFVLSDLLVVAAMLWIGGGVWNGFVGRISDMVRGGTGRGPDTISGRNLLHQSTARKKAGQ